MTDITRDTKRLVQPGTRRVSIMRALLSPAAEVPPPLLIHGHAKGEQSVTGICITPTVRNLYQIPLRTSGEFNFVCRVSNMKHGLTRRERLLYLIQTVHIVIYY